MKLTKDQKSFCLFCLVYILAFLLWCPFLWAKDISCEEVKPSLVRVNFGRLTVLSFPISPKEILGDPKSFDFKQIKNDLTIKALSPGARTNIVIYAKERRCMFNLVTVQSGGDDILLVKDPKDKVVEVKFND